MSQHPSTDAVDLPAALAALLSTEEPVVTALSNAAALIAERLDRINWCGFYLFDGERLVLGPFIGRPACTLIGLGEGVCGAAAKARSVFRVPDVEQFPGHIACDARSRSEIVLPLLLADGRLVGVLDIDSPELDRFSPSEEAMLSGTVRVLAGVLEAIEHRTGDLRNLLA